MSSAMLLDEMLEPLSQCLDEASARRVAELRVSDTVQARIEQLAEGANEGTLNEDERDEYEALVNATDFITILKKKSRVRFNS